MDVGRGLRLKYINTVIKIISVFICVYLWFLSCSNRRPVRAAVVDYHPPVRMLAGAQDYRAYADLFVVGGEDGGYGGQVGTSGGWVRWMWVGGSG